MIAFLEKSEHNVNFHQIVDFVEASYIRIKTIDEGTKILATVDEIYFSKRSILPSVEVSNPYHYAMFKPGKYRRARIAQSKALPTTADEHASLSRDDSQGEAFPTVFGLEARHDKENIIKTYALPHDSTPRVTSLAADEGSMQHQLQELTNLYTRLQRQRTEMALKINAQDLEISNLKARIKLLEDKDGGGAEPSGEDATIKGRSLETWEEAGLEKSIERGSNDTEELVNVLTSLDAANILTSGV
uniref:Uncharacterized protein n=1 Tax=Tanacetum cinerariifolium TaxID=118510 RepID=A0A699KDW3_TANCI|nr:hypothetical protein [Tanacetum cinerariifolium]